MNSLGLLGMLKIKYDVSVADLPGSYSQGASVVAASSVLGDHSGAAAWHFCK